MDWDLFLYKPLYLSTLSGTMRDTVPKVLADTLEKVEESDTANYTLHAQAKLCIGILV